MPSRVGAAVQKVARAVRHRKQDEAKPVLLGLAAGLLVGVVLGAGVVLAIRQIQAYKRRMGWTFRRASSHDTSFNYDFNTSFTEEQQRSGNTEYNYAPRDMRGALDATQPSPHAAMAGTDDATFVREAPGISAFARQHGIVYHTYSGYARGLDSLWGMYQWLDRAPLGRNDNGAWFRHHDRY